jgi:hypothetical protein
LFPGFVDLLHTLEPDRYLKEIWSETLGHDRHLDRNPAYNERANLVCVCVGCHLRLHRHHPKSTPGQLSLKLKLPRVRCSRQKYRNFQLTLADLIERLPQLPSGLDRQLELDFDDN